MKLEELKVKDIKRGNNPRNINKKELEKSDLFRSIKDNGVMQAIQVRKKNGSFELLAGDRRLTCAEMHGIETIWAIVYDLKADDGAADITHFENADREDLTPLEQSQDAINLMKAHKKIEDVALILGVTPQHIRMRVNIQKLTNGWKKYLETVPNNMNVMQLAVIARMPDKVQKDILAIQKRDWSLDISKLSVTDLEKWVNENYMHHISMAPWANEKCASCKKRSDIKGQADLWEAEHETTKDKLGFCMDEDCWNKNRIAYGDMMVKEIIKKNPDILLAKDDGCSYSDWQAAALKYGSLIKLDCYDSQYVTCKAKDKGAVKFVFVVGRIGKTGYCRTKKAAKVKKTGQKKEIRTLAERKKLHNSKRWHAAIKEIQDEVQKSKIEDLTIEESELPLMIAIFGTYMNSTSIGGNRVEWKAVDIGLDKKTINQKLFNELKDVFMSRIHHNHGVTQIPDYLIFEVKEVCKIMNIDSDSYFQKQVEELPDPKVWATLNADGTKKEKGK